MSDNVINWTDMHKFATTKLEGEFPVVIVEATATKTADQSKDMIKYRAKIESGPFVDRPITGNFTISLDSPTAMRILFGHWAVLGLDARFFEKNPNAPVAQIAEALVGRRALALVGQREWNGRTFDDIQEWKPALGGPGGGTAPLAGAPLGGSAPAASGPLASPAPASSGPSPASPTPASPASGPLAGPLAEPKTGAPALPF